MSAIIVSLAMMLLAQLPVPGVMPADNMPSSAVLESAKSSKILQGDVTSMVREYSDNIAANKLFLQELRRNNPEYLITAQAAYLNEAKENPKNASFQYLIACCYFELFLWKYSLYPAEGLIPQHLSIEANSYRRLFDYSIEKTYKMDPQMIEAYYLVLEMAQLQNDDARATWAVTQILRLRPRDFQAIIKMAELCFKQMAIDPETANAEYLRKTILYSRSALALSPHNLDALRYLAGGYEMAGDYERAIPLFNKIIDLDTEAKSSRVAIAKFWLRKMEHDIQGGTRRPYIKIAE